MFDCAYQPEWQPEPTALPKTASHSYVWLAAVCVIAAICLAGVLGRLASDYVMS